MASPTRKEQVKYGNEEERKRRLEIKKAIENLWKWRKKRKTNYEEGIDTRKREEREKMEGELEENIEKIDKIIERE